MTRKPIYLDHAATTPILPEVREAVAKALAEWANPSSVHAAGRGARAALEGAREAVAEALAWPHEVIFTSGASEALAIAWQRSPGTRKFAGATEHTAVLRFAGEGVIGVDAKGLIDPVALPEADLIAVQQVNNETGVIQPLADVCGPLLADCAQGATKLALPAAAFCVVAGHKLGAPPGIGLLLARDLAILEPSGGQERGYRPGTENLPYILGLVAALAASRDWLEGAGELRRWFEDEIAALGGETIADGAPRVPTIGAYRLPGVNASAVLIRADAAGIAISAGSACASGSIKPSHVLLAMGMDEARAREVFRVSIGRATTRADLEALLAVLTPMARQKAA
jgi:cysteine desulfurase